MRKLSKIFKLATLLSFILLANGCTTYITQVRFWDPEEGKQFFAGFPKTYQEIYKESLYYPVYIYGGTRTIIDWFDPDHGAGIITLFIIDFPFCFCGDTILLPLTIGEEIYEEINPSSEKYLER